VVAACGVALLVWVMVKGKRDIRREEQAGLSEEK